ncbi:MAG TPA: hypothetical protein VFI72_10695 [Candidatus Angelobacter sp.]|nr:hypothetical protein [Candidatus Angelobacter sp.]
MTNAFEDFRMFPAITEAWELQRTGLVVIREQLYRLELWHSYSNPDIPYYVSIFTQQDGVWKRVPDPPFATGRDGDDALRDAMVFLTERLAA